MNHASLFSGIGGFDLAAEWMGWENIFQVEIDKYATKVLEKNFPDVKRYKDIFDFDGTKYKGQIDIITGGFPCQPFSSAGKRKGRNDDRYLWPQMLRIIREVEPTYVVGENVAGLLSMENGKTFDEIQASLENEGYTVESFIIPACGVGAWHRRDRVWIVAYDKSRYDRRSEPQPVKRQEQKFRKSNNRNGIWASSNSSSKRSQKSRESKRSMHPKQVKEREINRAVNDNYWAAEPGVGRVADGIPNRVDRLKGLGNAIVPQVAFEIFKAIDANEK